MNGALHGYAGTAIRAGHHGEEEPAHQQDDERHGDHAPHDGSVGVLCLTPSHRP